MYGSRFTKFRRTFPRKRTTTRRWSNRSTGSSSRKLEGGNFFHTSALTVGEETDEITAPAVGGPIISNSLWTDWQWNHGTQTNEPENDLEPIIFAGGAFCFNVWKTLTGSPTMALLYMPFTLGLFVVDEHDTVGNGDPNDLAPVCIPNYFLLDYGRADKSAGGASPPPFAQESAWRRPARTLFRYHGMLDAGQCNSEGYTNNCEGYSGQDVPFYGTKWRQRITCRIKRHVLRRQQALYWALSAFNTSGDDHDIGIVISGHFGFRRLNTGS